MSCTLNDIKAASRLGVEVVHLALTMDRIYTGQPTPRRVSLLLNPQKKKEMIFTTKRATPGVKAGCMAGTPIPLSGAVKYLGVIIDEKLKFSERCSKVTTEANQRLYILNRFRYLGAKPSLLKDKKL